MVILTGFDDSLKTREEWVAYFDRLVEKRRQIWAEYKAIKARRRPTMQERCKAYGRIDLLSDHIMRAS